MTSLTSLTLAAARDLLRKREFSARDLTEAHLSAIEEARVLNAFVLETPERAREMAKRADERLAKGEGGPLEGMPLGVKDMFATRDRAHHRLLENPRRLRSRLRIDGHRQSVARRRGDARQAQQ